MAHKSNKVYMGDAGTVILLNCGVDISEATTTQIKVKKPDNSVEVWDAEIYEEKYVRYVTAQQEPAYHDLDMYIANSANDSGISINTIYKIVLNEEVIQFTTNGMTSPITYVDLINLFNTVLSPYDVEATIVNNTIRFTSTVLERNVVIGEAEDHSIFITLNGYSGIGTSTPYDLGDFNQYGKYAMQAYVEINNWKGHGETALLEVYKKFN